MFNRHNRNSIIYSELFLFIFVIISLYIKLVYFSSSLRFVWWAEPENIYNWIQNNYNVFLATFSCLLILFSPLILVPRILKYLSLLFLNLLITSLIIADYVRIHFHGDMVSLSDLENYWMLPLVSKSIIKRIEIVHLLFFVDIFALIALFIVHIKNSEKIKILDAKFRRKLLVFSLIIAIIISIPSFRKVLNNEDGTFAYKNLQREIASSFGLLPYHLIDVLLHVLWKEYDVDEEDIKYVENYLIDNDKNNDSESELFGIGKGLNLIVVIAESLQTLPIGLNVNDKPVTPYLNKFSSESLYFENFFDQTHLGTTADAEFISFQSLHALPVGVVASKYNKNDFYGLADILAERGYTTVSACGARGKFWRMNRMHPNLGFRKSFFEDFFNTKERIWRCIPDKDLFKEFIPILSELEQPFFAYLLSCSNHHPFDIPKKYIDFDVGELEGTLLGKYFQSVHFFDQAFGDLIKKLREKKLLESSIIAVFGDHHAFLDSDYDNLAHLLGIKELNEYQRFLTRKRLPLMIRLPNGSVAINIDESAGQIDVAPTLLSLLGISENKKVMLGKDLTKKEPSLVVFRDGSFIYDQYLYINKFPSSNSKCYQLENGERLNCKIVQEQRNKAIEQLEVSDLIIRGDLIPVILKN